MTILTVYSPVYSSTFPTFSHSLKIRTYGYSVTIPIFICTHTFRQIIFVATLW